MVMYVWAPMSLRDVSWLVHRQISEFDYTRVESYMGGMSFTPQVNAGSSFEQTHSAGNQAVKLGETLVYAKGGTSEVESAGKDKGPDGWIVGLPCDARNGRSLRRPR